MYKALTAATAGELESQVNELMAGQEGWMPVGGMGSNHDLFIQAMVVMPSIKARLEARNDGTASAMQALAASNAQLSEQLALATEAIKTLTPLPAPLPASAEREKLRLLSELLSNKRSSAVVTVNRASRTSYIKKGGLYEFTSGVLPLADLQTLYPGHVTVEPDGTVFINDVDAQGLPL